MARHAATDTVRDWSPSTLSPIRNIRYPPMSIAKRHPSRSKPARGVPCYVSTSPARHQGGEMVRKRMLLHRCIHSGRYHLQIMPDMLWSCAEQMEGDLKILPLHYSSQLFVYKFVLQFGTSVNPFQPRSFMVSDSTCCTCSHSSPVFFLNAEIRPLVELS